MSQGRKSQVFVIQPNQLRVWLASDGLETHLVAHRSALHARLKQKNTSTKRCILPALTAPPPAIMAPDWEYSFAALQLAGWRTP